MAIDIGLPAIDRSGTTGAGTTRTRIDVDNPANATGILTTVEIWANAAISNMKVGTFYLVSGTTYKCRASVYIGSVPAGSKQTYGGLSLEVQEGDYIGCYFGPDGTLEQDSTGYAGVYWIDGEYIDPGDEATYALASGRGLSLYGTGVIPKTSSDIGSGAEGLPLPSATLTGSETGSGIEALVARLLAAADTGTGVEVGGLFKDLFATELGRGSDSLTAKIEIPIKGGGMKLWT